MEKRLGCGDVGADCDFVACGRTGHGMNEIPKELYDKARSAIREVDHC